MQPFLNHIINKLLDNRDIPLHDVAVILPNRRARRRLLQGMHEANGGNPMFAPRIFPMEDFIDWLSPLHVIDPVSQLWTLYKASRRFQGERFELRNLMSWGVAFLKDVSDMDMQLQDVPAIFHEYADAAKFEVPFGKEDLSEGDQEKLKFNDLLADIYGLFRNLLKEKGEAYEGMLYRDCAENIAEYAQKIPFKRLVFAGFYALSPAELTVMHYLQEHFQTEFYFDLDPFYCHLEELSSGARVQREPSFFIKRNCEKLQLNPSQLDFNENHYATVPKEVQIVATAQNMRQIYGAIEEIERIKNDKLQSHPEDIAENGMVNMSDTAVVLADEELLLPFLSAYKPDNLNINATYNYNKNKVEKVREGVNADTNTNWGSSMKRPYNDYIIREGEPVGTILGYKSAGFYTVDDFNVENGVWTLKSGIADMGSNVTNYAAGYLAAYPVPEGQMARPGMVKFQDTDGNGTITEEDACVIGHTMPKHTGGININANYKDFDFSAGFAYQIGGDVYNANAMHSMMGNKDTSLGWNRLSIVSDCWKMYDIDANGDLVAVTDPTALRNLNAGAKYALPYNEYGLVNSEFIEDASYLRLNTVTIGYTLPKQLTKKVGISNLRVYFTGGNLFCITGYKGSDPDVNTRPGGNNGFPTPNYDWNAYPRARTYTFGLNVAF